MTVMADGSLDASIIDELGVATIAEAFDISQAAVRKWRKTGIPDNRQDALRNMVADRFNLVAIDITDRDDELLQPLERQPVLGLVAPDDRDMVGFGRQDVRRRAKLALAARRAMQARRHANQAAVEARGLPPIMPVYGYPARLAGLFVLDFPILTMAFVAVTQVSPIVAAGSAVALSLSLVLGAHLLGIHLRDMARHVPPWVPSFLGIAMIGTLIACIIAVTVDLRLKGFEIDALVAGLGQGGPIFGNARGGPLTLPAETQWSIVRAAALVTIMSTVFGIGWSFQRHAPQASFALAEAADARALKAYAAAVHRMRAKGSMAALAIMSMMGLGLTFDARADQCEGRHVLAFVDTTTTYDDHDRDAIMRAIDQMATSLKPGQHLVMRTVRDHPKASRVLLDECVPNPIAFAWSISGVIKWLLSNPAETRAEHQAFFVKVRHALLSELQSPGDADKTALVATIAQHARADGAIEAIWLFSDLLESSAVSAETLISQSKSLLSLASTLQPLEGATVHVAGIGRFHDGSRRALSSLERGRLVDSWSALISEAGGRIDVFN